MSARVEPHSQQPMRRGVAVSLLSAALVLCGCAPRSNDQLALPPADTSAAAVAPAAAPSADYRGHDVAAEVRSLVDWTAASNDHGSRPFAVIDKRAAHIYLFDGEARLVDSSWILLGQAIGDDSVPGIGAKAIADIKPIERTTPAGRFVTMPGRNADDRPVVWVDYDAGVSMHVVITDTPAERRLERLASPDPMRHRISWGCINLPPAFFTDVVQPAFADKGGIVYILPEVHPLTAVFPEAIDRGIARASDR